MEPSDMEEWVRSTWAEVTPIRGSLTRPLVLIFQRPKKHLIEELLSGLLRQATLEFEVRSHEQRSVSQCFLEQQMNAGWLALFKETRRDRAEQLGLRGERMPPEIDPETMEVVSRRFVEYACSVFAFDSAEQPWFQALDVIALGVLRPEKKGVEWNFARQTALAAWFVEDYIKKTLGYRERTPVHQVRLEGTSFEQSHILDLHTLVLGEMYPSD